MCLYPKIIQNKKYTANKKNKGKIPQMTDQRVQFVPVGCGKCMECRKKKGREWAVRLGEEIRTNKNGKFITFSFSNESLKELSKAIDKNEEKINKLTTKASNGLTGYNRDNEIATIGTRRFLERWRKKYKKSVKHWFITELGQNSTERIHIHGLLFTNETEETIRNIWKYGHVYIGEYVNEKTINYIVKYVSKSDKKHPNYTSKILTSPGIGSNYTNRKDSKNNKYKEGKTQELYTTKTGSKLALPVYYRNKIYTEEEREKLWLEKLDKEVRYINGKEIDVSKGYDIYYKVLEEERQKNKRLGYGDDEINWEKKYYENQMRMLKQSKYLKE